MSSIDQNSKQHNVEFPILKSEGGEDIQIYDLNKIFQMTYNFDLLKNLLESLIENQKKLKAETSNITSQLREVRSTLSLPNVVVPQETAESQPEKKQGGGGKPPAITPRKAGVIRPPPIDNRLEISVNNDDVINKIIVSKLYIIFF